MTVPQLFMTDFLEKNLPDFLPDFLANFYGGFCLDQIRKVKMPIDKKIRLFFGICLSKMSTKQQW